MEDENKSKAKLIEELNELRQRNGELEDAFVRIADYDKIIIAFHKKDFINSAGLAVLFDLTLPAKD